MTTTTDRPSAAEHIAGAPCTCTFSPARHPTLSDPAGAMTMIRRVGVGEDTASGEHPPSRKDASGPHRLRPALSEEL